MQRKHVCGSAKPLPNSFVNCTLMCRVAVERSTSCLRSFCRSSFHSPPHRLAHQNAIAEHEFYVPPLSLLETYKLCVLKPSMPVQAPVTVRVMYGESPRSTQAAPSDTIGSIILRLFSEELADSRRVRLIFGGAVRPDDATLKDLYLGRELPGVLTMHAIVSALGGSPSHPTNSSASAGWSSPPSSASRSTSSGMSDQDTINVGSLKLQPVTCLLSVLGVGIALLWCVVAQLPAAVNRVSFVLLVAFTIAFGMVLRGQCYRAAAAQGQGNRGTTAETGQYRTR